jgi:hypothetical protein
MKSMAREFGMALMVGGLLLILLNAVFTPMMPVEDGEEVMRTSWPYLVRLSLAIVSAMALVLGVVGVRLAMGEKAGVFDKVAFWVAFLGNCLLIGLEWSNVFVLRPVAQVAPEVLESLDAAPLLGIGFGTGAGLFGLGWILLSISVWRRRLGTRWAPALIVGGLVVAGVLGATPLGATGMIIGSVVMGAGMAWLGWGVIQV